MWPFHALSLPIITSTMGCTLVGGLKWQHTAKSSLPILHVWSLVSLEIYINRERERERKKMVLSLCLWILFGPSQPTKNITENPWCRLICAKVSPEVDHYDTFRVFVLFCLVLFCFVFSFVFKLFLCNSKLYACWAVAGYKVCMDRRVRPGQKLVFFMKNIYLMSFSF